MERWLTPRNTLLLVVVLTGWRLYLTATLQLHPDEAYYWLWSKHPAFGYFDHPPMVAWFIWLGTRGSDGELWVRLAGPLTALLASGLLWRLARQLYDSVPVAAASVLLFNALPLTQPGLLVMTPDVPLFLFTAASVVLFRQAVQGPAAWPWYALGLSFGLALLSKYTAVLLAPCFLLYLAATPARRWLRTPHPYLALLLGLALFLPVVEWNSRHEWVSFAFQLDHGLEGGRQPSWHHVAEYVAGQMLLLGPLSWLLGLYAALTGLLHRERAAQLLGASTLPVLAFFALTSYRTPAGPNWPAYAYFGVCVLAAGYAFGAPGRGRRALWALAWTSSLALSLGLTLHARFGLVPLGQYSRHLAVADFTNGFHGWRELAHALPREPAPAFVLTPSHQLAAEITYYTAGQLPARPDAQARPSQFNLWPAPARTGVDRGLYVWTEGGPVSPYADHFDSTTHEQLVRIRRGGTVVRTCHIVAGHPAAPLAQRQAPVPPDNRRSVSRMKAGRSAGRRAVTSAPSTTTSRSS